MNVAPGATYEAVFETGVTGLTGTFAIGLTDNVGGITEALSTVGVIETPAGSGVYTAVRTAPATAGEYTIIGSLDGSYDPDQVTIDDLVVTSAADAIGADTACGVWITADDVAAVCAAIDGTDTSVYDTAAQEASDVLYRLSGRQFAGLCGPVTVRPCEPRGCPPADPCGCCHLSTVKLAGYAREITAVKIDGEVLDTGEYRLDRHKYLVRLADTDGKSQVWPGCQRLDLEDTEEKTFSVSYTFGQSPPQLGLDAAAQLACQLAAFGATGDCDLPAGATRVTRQGITIDLEKAPGQWWIGLPLVAAFLRTYNPQGLRRRSAVWSPDVQPFAQKVG